MINLFSLYPENFSNSFIHFVFNWSLKSWASLIAQLVKNLPAMQEILVWFLGQARYAGEGIGSPLQYSWASLKAQMEKNPGDLGSHNAGDLGLILELGRSLGEGNKCPLQYSGLENPMDYIVHGVTKSQTWLSNFHSLHLGMQSHKQQEIKITSFLVNQHLYRLLCLHLFCIH